MSFSINTNVASLQAQNYLAINQNFQNKTINEVTSGLRIVNSGDDAAGLAIANGYRSDEAVLTQGIQNANNGVSTLQIMDGGMSNISQLLDRARTLATQSASGTFTGSRSVLDNEFQSVLGEIDRQAQSIGLNQGGIFAQNLSVFIGGGKGTNASGVIGNGTVSVDLGGATVDTQSLGLKGFTAGYQVAAGSQDSGLYDLSSGGATSVSAIIAANTVNNGASTQFVLSGPGFSQGAGGATPGANGAVTITANLTSVGDPASLAAAINAGIQGAIAGGSSQDQALRAANITAVIHTGADGHQQLVFTSPDAAFDVSAGDATANGLLGNLTTLVGAVAGNNSGGLSAPGITATASTIAANSDFIGGGTQQIDAIAFTAMTGGAAGTQDKQTLTFTANNSAGTPQTTNVTLDAGAAGLTATQAIASINQQLQATDNPALQSIVASVDGVGGAISFSSNSPSPFSVSVGQDVLGAPGGVADANGLAQPATTIVQSAVVGVGATSSIATESSAQAAVSALAVSVSTLGSAQAAVGRGENQFTYAINLAQSELTNETAAESGIRDADLAAQAANLTKAQILLQAGVAALAQANAAPQNILALLKA
jgi:flagellin-like hook-associated protein FlgL